MMPVAKTRFLAHALPSLTDIVFVLPVLLLFSRMGGAKALLGDGDTGWHVRTGEWILSHHMVPVQDLFSFTKAGAPWFAWEWLSDVLFAWLHQNGGLASVVVGSLCLICLTFALLFHLMVRRGTNRLLALMVTMLAVGGSSVHWLARPHLFTMLFVVLWLMVKDRAEEGRTYLLWVLPPLTVLWTNLHGGFFVGILLTAACCVGKLMEGFFVKSVEERAEKNRWALRYMGVTMSCLAASLVNPYTFHLHQHIAAYLNDSAQLSAVNEFQSLSFHAPSARFFEIMLALGAIAAFRQMRARRFAEAILIVGWAHLSLMAARNIPLFLLISAPVIAATLDDLLREARVRSGSLPECLSKTVDTLFQVSEELDVADKPWRLHVLPAATIIILASVVSFGSSSPLLKADFDSKRYPVSALQAINSTIGSQRIFSDDEWGDYLAYRFYPVSKVFIDGRTDFYGAAFGRHYDQIMAVKYDWESQLHDYRIDTLLLSTNSALAATAKQAAGWKVIYDDGVAIVFEASRPANKISTNSGNEHVQAMKPNLASRTDLGT